jgi:hypothetical protein
MTEDDDVREVQRRFEAHECLGCGTEWTKWPGELVQLDAPPIGPYWACVECRRPAEVDPETGYQLRPFERFHAMPNGKLAVVHLFEPVPAGYVIDLVPNQNGTGRLVYVPLQ